jgi:hypothetical protein
MNPTCPTTDIEHTVCGGDSEPYIVAGKQWMVKQRDGSERPAWCCMACGGIFTVTPRPYVPEHEDRQRRAANDG